ncbi:MAG: aspartyl protease family protein [Chloroflexi bacterium]|nr:aspartyl protease family protein [Chloroflexota bacterium]MDA1004295.1 aspartyl protease family protein [Chloroflexota bacterium]MQC28130.1 aspartyl protease [Chloroflexota bacterium]
MGLTTVDLEVANPSDITRWESVECLVDSGATYSVIPASVLDALGIRPIAEQEFRLANGDRIRRRKGSAAYRYGEHIGGADVIFGEDGDANLLGVMTLEALGLALDPLRRELRELPMLLSSAEECGAELRQCLDSLETLGARDPGRSAPVHEQGKMTEGQP